MAARPRQRTQIFLHSVPRPFRNRSFAREEPDEPKRQDAIEPQALEDVGSSSEARGADQFRNQETAASGFWWHAFGSDLVVPVEERQKNSIAVASDPGATRQFGRIQRFDAVRRMSLRRASNRTSSQLIPIHRGQVAIGRWDKG